MDEFKWGRMNKDDVYLDHFHVRTLNVIRMRMRFGRLANALIAEGKKEKAEKVLDRIIELTPNDKVPYDYFIVYLAESYYRLNKFDKANELLSKYQGILESNLKYWLEKDKKYRQSARPTIQQDFEIMARLGQVAKRYNQMEISDTVDKFLEENSWKF
jgi:tetratricopeptide (TPR) repeat protein